jgi:hypothetical protein
MYDSKPALTGAKAIAATLPDNGNTVPILTVPVIGAFAASGSTQSSVFTAHDVAGASVEGAPVSGASLVGASLVGASDVGASVDVESLDPPHAEIASAPAITRPPKRKVLRTIIFLLH